MGDNHKESHRWVEVDGRVRCFLVKDGSDVREVASALNFARSKWLDTPAACIDAEALTLVRVPLCPTTVPAELLQLPEDAVVVLRDEVDDHDVIKSAASVRGLIESRIDRTRLGRLSAREAAAVLADATHDWRLGAYERIVEAFKAGDLAFRETEGGYRTDGRRHAKFTALQDDPQYLLAEISGIARAYTTRADINRWLEGIAHPMRVPMLPSEQPHEGLDASPGETTGLHVPKKTPAPDPHAKKLPESARRLIREKHKAGISKSALAAEFDVSRRTIDNYLKADKPASPSLETAWKNTKLRRRN